MSDHSESKSNDSFMLKLATFIVDKRNLFFLITIIGIIFSLIASGWVEVENTLSEYLPDDSESRQGLDIMEEQFTTYGTANIMVANVSLDTAQELRDRIAQTSGVQSVVFDDSEEYYNNVSALYVVTFDYDETDDQCLTALDAVEQELSEYDVYISTALGNTIAETIDAEVRVIMVIVAFIVVQCCFSPLRPMRRSRCCC